MTETPPPLAATEPVQVRTLSDWRIGTGWGVPGDLNAVMRRDADGLPYLPGTSLTGVVRDACRVVAIALDDGATSGVWQRWHTHVFGTRPTDPGGRTERRLRPALAALGAARLPAHQRQAITAAGAADNLLVRRASVAIDPGNGRAKDAALRFTQVARAGVDLQTKLTLDPLPADPAARTTVTALLVLGTAWCTQIGADRRRGLGHVNIRLGDHDPAMWARWLAHSGFQPAEPPATARPVATAVAEAPSGDWVAADLVVTVERPLRVPSQTAGNIMRGLDHVPGSVLLPWLGQRWGETVVSAGVWHRALIVRNVLPEIDGERGLPAPLSLHASREEDHFYHLSPLTTADVPDGPAPGNKQVRGHYTTGAFTEGSTFALTAVELARASHNTVDPATQRPTSATGVFEVEAIPAGTRLRGRVLIRQSLLDSVSGNAWQLLEGPARWGARRRGEYGAVTVRAVAASLTTSGVPRRDWVLWAVADLALRDRTGRLTASPGRVAALLAECLGTTVEVQAAVTRTRRRDGWHGRWQLPRETIIGLAAGSVLRLRFPDGPPDERAWRELLVTGIGDRVAEGYGEIAVDPPLLTLREARTATALTPPRARSTTTVADLPDRLRAAVVADRARDLLPATRDTIEYTELAKALRKLSRSQRGEWRAAAAAAAVSGALAPVSARIDKVTSGALQRRQSERKLAQLLNCLIGRRSVPSLRTWWTVLDEHGIPMSQERDRASAIATLISDAIDGLRRDGTTS